MKHATKPAPHPVHTVHRIGAVLLGLVLWAFGVLGLLRGLDFFTTSGQPVLGLSSNGLLAVISLVAGAVLIGCAAWGGRQASTVTTFIGVLFLLSGLVHLAVLNSPWNLLAFRLPNVFFSLVAGLVLLCTGLYGRLSGGLPPDNPYRREHPMRTRRPDPEEQLADARGGDPDEDEQRYREAEIAMGEGHPTPEQTQIVLRDQARRRAVERARARRRTEGGRA
ncbi:MULTISPECIES: DUF4383 domain-containing protein [unclassified Saccharopolyspora]|uniref:DUF4383 domain-containing protein n=1 Tax=unclassified Saccharopolyspora TaxID=2646250 RepID=UPI001CD5D87D|nr:MULTISPECIES: DUF4383 domain-containing protein [unclassified Saccharopolyspora]MCA1185991.1 DUF4383 domain-containing protein [Saccharopolyspora sp. 6T]MCA1192374.1 DUF4383 domain-containing protein [Saccharopolyspora sp. 6V]MCA1227960.1 DUF4383 domain-containing protein [Saccharopolyspora sp. 6M]MCA1282527.1 DUF4383 domain-containing protein [Saccharopolyspora sp. 7B]